jgi:hypothetical protein
VWRKKTKARISPLWPDVVEVLFQFSDLVIPGTFPYWFPLAEMGPIPNGTTLNADGLFLDLAERNRLGLAVRNAGFDELLYRSPELSPGYCI